MTRPPLPFAFTAAAALLTAALLVATAPATAADAHAEAAHEAPLKKAAAKPAADGHAKVEPVAEEKMPVRAAKPSIVDPMDRIRERLAEKLGAHKAPDAGSPNIVRVAAPATLVAPPAHAAAPARRPTVSAAAMAAAHRASVAAAAPVAHAAPAHAPHWDYQGAAGPESWGALQAEFSKCSVGTRQSPIDIRDGVKVQLDAVQFDYKPGGFRVIDNGHTVQVNLAPGNSIEVLGRRYDLLQFHFHRPSEERINGRQFDMVAHLVHKDVDGRLAVVAVLLDRGSAHAVVQAVWNNLPLEKGEEVPAKTALDMNALLPADRSYYTYMGSLTTPPCSEGVLWMVMKNPVPISADQIGIFARLYPMNARPIQQASGRLIKESN
jgi:carbonic anhydrase